MLKFQTDYTTLFATFEDFILLVYTDYYGAVEPPVRQSQSHSSDGTEPL